MVLNAAYLVEESGVTTFVDAVQTGNLRASSTS
jgi:hypothetical protein